MTAPICDLYIPGHMVHWIQARLASEHPRAWGKLDGVDGEVITVRFWDRVARYRNHHAEAVLASFPAGTKVHVSERYGLLGVPLPNGNERLLCIMDADKPWRPCSVAPSPPESLEDLVDQVRDRGGFSIPASFLPTIEDSENTR